MAQAPDRPSRRDYGGRNGVSRDEAALMAAELRQGPSSVYVIDLACDLEEDWGDDAVGAGVRVDAHNEAAHPTTPLEPSEPSALLER